MTQDSRGGESRGDRLVKRERGAFRPCCLERLGAQGIAAGWQAPDRIPPVDWAVIGSCSLARSAEAAPRKRAAWRGRPSAATAYAIPSIPRMTPSLEPKLWSKVERLRHQRVGFFHVAQRIHDLAQVIQRSGDSARVA